MVEDKKNNDNKEELKTSSDQNDMDIQEQKIDKNNEFDEKKEVSDNQIKEDQAEKLEENQTEKLEENKTEKLEENQTEKLEENQTEKLEDNQENKVDDEKDDPNAKWYVVGIASSFEEKAVQTIKDNARKASLSHFFFDFQIPKQEVVEIKRGKKINTEKNFFPGYMLIKMIMNNDTWQLVKNSNKVSGFTGNDHKPIPLPQNEAMKMLKKADDSIEYIAPKYVYEVGQQVKVIEGPFASFNGMVEEVDEERGRLKISVSIFGRSTPVELEYTQVEKI
ncbi:MAG: hypothetical protein CFH26_00158 [Alphaproteobacteria bacterium MarineAlpha6_Bin4]|nr:MAG: hypothetical protein CFH25_00439 [Alphaproteobacteria bacterium MarineAlpha6_Bin3]PPR38281.1 MAG: hypothetical protein CFH26_00158 [Alphaproteobacteria bacterium MarineAlpha6_Bin4]